MVKPLYAIPLEVVGYHWVCKGNGSPELTLTWGLNVREQLSPGWRIMQEAFSRAADAEPGVVPPL